MVLAEAGDLEGASRRLDEAERLAGIWQGGPWAAAVWEARGVLRQAEGRAEQAAALLQEAAGRYGELGRPAAQARCQTRAAALLHAAQGAQSDLAHELEQEQHAGSSPSSEGIKSSAPG
jgi:ATP/maltotriose-dependent transcriptional regulator MalT